MHCNQAVEKGSGGMKKMKKKNIAQNSESPISSGYRVALILNYMHLSLWTFHGVVEEPSEGLQKNIFKDFLTLPSLHTERANRKSLIK